MRFAWGLFCRYPLQLALLGRPVPMTGVRTWLTNPLQGIAKSGAKGYSGSEISSGRF
jgi:hypothetical protein